MPEGCLEKRCADCEWHVTKGGVLDCNVKNRLGLAEPVLGSFTSKETDKEVLKRKVKAKEKELEELKGVLEESGGESGGGVP